MEGLPARRNTHHAHNEPTTVVGLSPIQALTGFYTPFCPTNQFVTNAERGKYTVSEMMPAIASFQV